MRLQRKYLGLNHAMYDLCILESLSAVRGTTFTWFNPNPPRQDIPGDENTVIGEIFFEEQLYVN